MITEIKLQNYFVWADDFIINNYHSMNKSSAVICLLTFLAYILL